MLRVYYSNQTESLLEALAESIDSHRHETGVTPFHPTHLIVPNRNIETYVKLGLARLTGIASNIDVRFLREALNDLAENGAGEGRVLDGLLLRDLVLSALFDDALLAEPEMAPVRQYLDTGRDGEQAENLRRVQLAREMSRLFEEYAASRPQLIECWRAGMFMGPDAARSTELWQRRLWRQIFGEGGLVDLRSTAGAPIQGTAFDVLGQLDAWKLRLPPRMHLFGISYMARSFLAAIGRLAKATDIFVYTLHPCREVWEDGVPMAGIERYERRSSDLGPSELFSLEDPFRLEDSRDMPALRLWGRPGRENLRLLNGLTSCELVSKIQDPAANPETCSLLSRVQHDIVFRFTNVEKTLPERDFSNDDSIVMMSCPSVRRELEIVAAEIWSLIRADDASRSRTRLRFNEIAVIVPPKNAEAYQALLGSVFTEMHELPHNVVDLPLASESRLVEALELLLELPLGGFTRQQLLRFVTHPVIIAGFPEATAEDWVEWCQRLGIVHGADRRDHRDTYIEKDLFNWSQGMRRLALGAFMEADDQAEPTPLAMDDQLYLPETLDPASITSAASFGLLIRSLLEDARFARNARLTLPAWMDFLAAMISTYLKPQCEEDERARRKCLERIAALGEMNLDGRKLPYHAALVLAREQLASLRGARGQYLSDGVVFSSFLPMRAIPFKVIFVVGLGEKNFPAPTERSDLDLRRASRRAGDVDARERDQYLFLETILCARDKLYLSHVSRDPMTGDRLSASSLVCELEQMLKDIYLPGGIRRRVYSLRRYDDPHTRQVSRTAEREARARELGRHLRRARGITGDTPSLDVLRNELPENIWMSLRQELGAPHDSRDGGVRGVVQQRSRPRRVSLSAIRKFLECPLQGSVNFLLRMKQQDHDDPLACEDEVFRTDQRAKSSLLRSVFAKVVRQHGGRFGDSELATTYDETALSYELRGQSPTGIFRDCDRRLHLEILAGWRSKISELTGNEAFSLRHVVFGGATYPVDDADRHPPIVLTLERPRRLRVEISGTSLPLMEPGRASLRLSSSSSFLLEREFFRGFLDHVLLSAAAVEGHTTHAIHVVNARPGEKTVGASRHFEPMAASHAIGYLRNVIEDMLSGAHDYLFPCDAIFASMGDDGAIASDRLAVALGKLADGASGTSSQYGPIEHPEDFAPPSLSEARQIIERRYGLYFQRLREEALS